MKFLSGGVLTIILLLAALSLSFGAEQAQESFTKSLHHTGRGMKHWYEAKDGFMQITKVPYDQLGCKNCHAKGCGTCHLKQTEQCPIYSVKKASSAKTCLKCHAREKATISIDIMTNCKDVHRSSYLTCVDCHTHQEIHGNGTEHKSMRETGAMGASCTDCHIEKPGEFPSIPQTESHEIHMDALACNACHVQNTMAGYNCHFGELAKTKSKPKALPQK